MILMDILKESCMLTPYKSVKESQTFYFEAFILLNILTFSKKIYEII